MTWMNVIVSLRLHPAFALMVPNSRFGTPEHRTDRADGYQSHPSPIVQNCLSIPMCPWDIVVATNSTKPSRKSGGGRECRRTPLIVFLAVSPVSGIASHLISLPNFLSSLIRG